MTASARYFAAMLVLCALLAPGRAAATAQQPDRLILEGKEQRLHTNPLSGWLAQHPGVLPRGEYSSTGNWRGYVATWEIAGDRLLLRKVGIMARPKGAPEDGSHLVETDVVRVLFPGSADVVATWYSGALVVPRGKLVNYVHMGYGSDYERYVVLSIRAGRVVDRRDLTYAQFRDYRQARFAAWKATPQYAAAKAKLREGDTGGEWEDADIDDFFAGFYAEQYLAIEPEVEE